LLGVKVCTVAVRGASVFVLGYPNREVESALNKALLQAWGAKPQPALAA
jgi:hypothetical protein